ncbi:sigma 54-interacting transcriptional regulator [Tistlia consotensis]|uniref:sigma 54-interacting transcriptional regulator n=1 Tax=Tistlia consotensis TaxID=1321365 RepID=UPI00190EE224|nr:sigma-54 dependent transcriptional regulator [Tistlia consotensis]
MADNSLFSDLGIVGRSPSFLRIQTSVARYAECDVPVLIHGETGTGKELVARALHYLSGRRDRPFVPVNCGALPDSLVENELFGHRRGAYTDARAEQRGMVALAEGGSLLLDEVDALDRRAQVTLLRFLQDRQYRPLGAEALVQADVRIVAASNADLKGLVEAGAFRQDLLFRLDVAAVEVPPLRERGDDVLLLAEHFLDRYARQYQRRPPTLGPAARLLLLGHDWPGNVRELENAMHRAAILADQGRLDELPPGVLPEPGQTAATEAGAAVEDPDYRGGLKRAKARCLQQFERRYLEWLLCQTRGNVSAAARTAGTERRHLGRMIKRAGLSAEMFRGAEADASSGRALRG